MAAAQPLKIRMVAGLGNPGDEYAETRHNAGFKAIDELARQAGVTYWKNQRRRGRAHQHQRSRGRERQASDCTGQATVVHEHLGGSISKLCRRPRSRPRSCSSSTTSSIFPPATYALRGAAAMPVTTGCVPSSTRSAAATSAVLTGIGNPPARWLSQTTCSSSCAPARPRISGYLRPRCRRRRSGDRARRNLRPRSRKRRRFRQRQALKPTI